MKFIASIHIYDVFEDIQVSAVVREYADYDAGPVVEARAYGTLVPGRGEADPRQWLRGALEGLMEEL